MAKVILLFCMLDLVLNEPVTAQELKKDLERELNEARSTTTQGLMEIMRRVANEDGLALPDIQIHQRRITNPGGVDDSAIAFSV